MEFVAVDRYGESGTWSEVMELMNLTPEAITAAARRVLARK
jgi:transketolase